MVSGSVSLLLLLVQRGALPGRWRQSQVEGTLKAQLCLCVGCYVPARDSAVQEV